MKSLTIAAISGLIAIGCATQKNSDSQTKQGLDPGLEDDLSNYNGMIGSELSNLMADKKVSDVLSKKMISTMEITTEFASTTTIYTINISYSGSDEGLNGPQSVPCNAIVQAQAIGGVAGMEAPSITDINAFCAPAQTFPTPAGVPGGIIDNPGDIPTTTPGIIYETLLAVMNSDEISEQINTELISSMGSFFTMANDRINYSLAFGVSDGVDAGGQGPQSVPCFLAINAHVLHSSASDEVVIDYSDLTCAAAIGGPVFF